MDYPTLRSWVPLAMLGGVAFVATLLVAHRPRGNSSTTAAGQVVQNQSEKTPARLLPPLGSAPGAVQPAGSAGVPGEVVLSIQELEDRSWAIAALAARPGAESARALAHVLASSGDYRERLEAVSALHRMAATGAVGDIVRRALENAVSDRNAEVAARARAALFGG